MENDGSRGEIPDKYPTTKRERSNQTSGGGRLVMIHSDRNPFIERLPTTQSIPRNRVPRLHEKRRTVRPRASKGKKKVIQLVPEAGRR